MASASATMDSGPNSRRRMTASGPAAADGNPADDIPAVSGPADDIPAGVFPVAAAQADFRPAAAAAREAFVLAAARFPATGKADHPYLVAAAPGADFPADGHHQADRQAAYQAKVEFPADSVENHQLRHRPGVGPDASSDGRD